MCIRDSQTRLKQLARLRNRVLKLLALLQPYRSIPCVQRSTLTDDVTTVLHHLPYDCVIFAQPIATFKKPFVQFMKRFPMCTNSLQILQHINLKLF